MSLDESVDLVLHAYKNGQQGDIFVQKAPASTIGNLARAMIDIFGKDNSIRIIGTRHGEKLYETLVSREEMARAEEMGDYYRIPADGRDLNYAQYVNEGEIAVSQNKDYTSHNTKILSVEEIKSLLKKQDWIKSALQ
jgi:UDP-glucose 4-epimerase